MSDSRIIIRRTLYASVHGRPPRGRARWTFGPLCRPAALLTTTEMTFAQAERWAKAQILRNRKARQVPGHAPTVWDAVLWVVLP